MTMANAAAHRMSDDMHAFDVKRRQRASITSVNSAASPGADVLAGQPVPRQIQRECPAAFAQCRLIEHPRVEIGAEAVQQQHRTPSPLPSSRQRSVPPERLQLARRHRCRILRRGSAGSTTANCATNASISAAGVSAGAITASSAPIGKVVPSGATMRVSVPAASASTTLVILLVSISSSSSPGANDAPGLLQPLHDLALGHRETPFRHGDRGDRPRSSGVSVHLAHRGGDSVRIRDVELFQ